MTTPWGLPDFDAHEALHFIDDQKCGLRAIIAVHSTHLGPAAGGCRFWHYPADDDAIVDALRLSRGMSYKNAMAGLPLGGGTNVWGYWIEGKAATGDIMSPEGKVMEKAGAVRDGGSFEARMGAVACWNSVMDEDRYMVRRWNEFIAA